MANMFDTFFSEENLSEVWRYMQEYAGQAGREATRVVLELFFVMKSPETSMIDKGIIIAALGYQFLPEDLIPHDKYGLFSLLDNSVTIAFAYSRMKADVTPAISARVEAILDSWFGTPTDAPRINDSVSHNDVEVTYPTIQNTRDTIGPSLRNSDVPRYLEDDEDVIVD